MRTLSWIAAACLIAAAIPGAPVRHASATVRDSDETAKPPQIIPSGPLSLECWQYGRKIIERGGLRDLQSAPEMVARWFSFRGPGDQPLVVTRSGDTTCLIGGDHGEEQR